MRVEFKHGSHIENPTFVGRVFYGAAKTIRTSDLFLRREALYPAELWLLGAKNARQGPCDSERRRRRIMSTDKTRLLTEVEETG